MDTHRSRRGEASVATILLGAIVVVLTVVVAAISQGLGDRIVTAGHRMGAPPSAQTDVERVQDTQGGIEATLIVPSTAPARPMPRPAAHGGADPWSDARAGHTDEGYSDPWSDDREG